MSLNNTMFKKLVCVMCSALFLLSLGSVAFAENIVDLSNYSDEELIELQGRITQEMVDRKIVKSAILPQGRYEVGVDIPTGKYTVSLTKESTSSEAVFLYKDNSSTTIGNLVDSGYLYFEDSLVLKMEEGNILSTSAELLMTIFTGIQFE